MYAKRRILPPVILTPEQIDGLVKVVKADPDIADAISKKHTDDKK